MVLRLHLFHRFHGAKDARGGIVTWTPMRSCLQISAQLLLLSSVSLKVVLKSPQNWTKVAAPIFTISMAFYFSNIFCHYNSKIVIFGLNLMRIWLMETKGWSMLRNWEGWRWGRIVLSDPPDAFSKSKFHCALCLKCIIHRNCCQPNMLYCGCGISRRHPFSSLCCVE